MMSRPRPGTSIRQANRGRLTVDRASTRNATLFPTGRSLIRPAIFHPCWLWIPQAGIESRPTPLDVDQ